MGNKRTTYRGNKTMRPASKRTSNSKRTRMGTRMRRYRRKRRNNNYTYATSSKPTRYGPGTNKVIVNNFHNITSNALTRISISHDILSSSEFNAKAVLFKYFKIKSVKVIFYPLNAGGTVILVNLSWNQISSSYDYLEKDDSTKIVTGFRTKTKVFTWLPPRMILNVNSTSETVPTNFLDVSRYLEVDRIVDLPGWIFIYNTNSGTYNINVEINISFRANDYFNTSGKMQKFLDREKKGEFNKKSEDVIERIPEKLEPIKEENKEELKEDLDEDKKEDKEINEDFSGGSEELYEDPIEKLKEENKKLIKELKRLSLNTANDDKAKKEL